MALDCASRPILVGLANSGMNTLTPKITTTLVAALATMSLCFAAQAQNAPPLDTTGYFNDTSWVGGAFEGDPIGGYSEGCSFVLQIDIRQRSSGGRELVVQTACEETEQTEAVYYVREGQSAAITNLPHAGGHFFGTSGNGQEFRFVREFDAAQNGGVSRDRLRVWFNSVNSAEHGRVFWEVLKNGTWSTISSIAVTRRTSHPVIRPVPDESQLDAVTSTSTFSTYNSHSRRRPLQITPVKEDVTNLLIPPRLFSFDDPAPEVDESLFVSCRVAYGQNCRVTPGSTQTTGSEPIAPPPGLSGRPARRTTAQSQSE